MTDLAAHEAAATGVEAGSPRDDALALLQAWDGYKQRVAELDRFVRDQLLAWCEANGKLELGDGTYLIARVPSERPCNDNRAFVQAALDATGGDVDAVAACIKSDGIKHGAAGKVLPADEFDRLFPKKEKPTLQKGGKALVKVDPKWIEQR
jgi:hypothetical protein